MHSTLARTNVFYFIFWRITPPISFAQRALHFLRIDYSFFFLFFVPLTTVKGLYVFSQSNHFTFYYILYKFLFFFIYYLVFPCFLNFHFSLLFYLLYFLNPSLIIYGIPFQGTLYEIFCFTISIIIPMFYPLKNSWMK